MGAKEEKKSVFFAEVDGSAEPNPGPGGFGVYLEGGGKSWERSKRLEYTTNNEAEYLALLEAVRMAKQHGAEKLVVQTDSQLLFHQVRGEWRVREPRLRALLEAVRKEAGSMSLEMRWVPREQNARADRLSRKRKEEE